MEPLRSAGDDRTGFFVAPQAMENAMKSTARADDNRGSVGAGGIRLIDRERGLRDG